MRKLTDGDWFMLALALAGACGLLMAFAANAHDATLDWVHPTEYTDGQPMPLEQVRETRIEYARCVEQQFPAQAEGSLVVPGPVATASVAGLPNGWWCFRAFTVSAEGVESDPSATAVVHFIGKPNPPQNLVAGQ